MSLEREKKYLLLAVLLAFAFSLLRFSTIPVGTFFDDAHYLILAEGLIEGSGYRLINFPSMPTEQAFPPGWPLLLAPFAGLFPGNLMVPKLLALFFSIGSIPLADLLFRDRLAHLERLLFLLMVALNPLFIGAAGTAMSEPAFLFFSLLTLVLLDRFLSARESNESTHWNVVRMAAVVLLCAGFSMVVRTTGITLVMAIVPFLVPKRRWRQMTFLSLAGAVIGGILLFLLSRGVVDFSLFSPQYSEHVQYLSGELGSYLRFWDFLPWFDWPAIGNVLVPIFDLNLSFVPFFDLFKSIAPIVIILLVLSGFALSLSPVSKIRPTEIYFLLFLALFYLWTAYIDEVQQRQLIPVIPFFTFYLIKILFWGGERLAQAKWQKAAFGVPLFFCSVIILLLVGRNVQAWLNPVKDTVLNYEVGGTWLQENTEADVVYAVNYPHPSYLYSRRLTEYLPVGLGPLEFEEYVVDRNISYLLIQPDFDDWDTGQLEVRPEVARDLVPYLETNPERYRLVFKDEANRVTIFEVVGQ